jgi:hypothetical protein
MTGDPEKVGSRKICDRPAVRDSPCGRLSSLHKACSLIFCDSQEPRLSEICHVIAGDERMRKISRRGRKSFGRKPQQFKPLPAPTSQGETSGRKAWPSRGTHPGAGFAKGGLTGPPCLLLVTAHAICNFYRVERRWNRCRIGAAARTGAGARTIITRENQEFRTTYHFCARD